MGLFIQVLVYSSKEYAIVTFSVNNLVTWGKFRTSETKKSPKFAKRWVYGTTPGEFTLLFLQFYQSFSISYIEIGLSLNLNQIFAVIKLMSGCGKGKYLTEICWKLSIVDSKALISCIFPKNIVNFCDFLENTCMYHVFNQNILPRDLKIA